MARDRHQSPNVVCYLEIDLSIPANLGLSAMSNASSASGVSGSIAGSVLPIRRAEELIVTLPGVLSTRIVPGDSGMIDEIHVLTTDAVPPKSTVRNIESALMAHLGLRVNHRKISVATTLEAPRVREQPTESVTEARAAAPAASFSAEGAASSMRAVPDPGVAAAGGPVSGPAPVGATETAAERSPRSSEGGPAPTNALSSSLARAQAVGEGRRVLIFEDVEVRRSRTKGVLCRVTLSRGDTHFVGESEGQESERSRVELAARATLSAISQAASSPTVGERSLALEGAKVIEAFDRNFVFVSVTARLGRDMVVLTGSCEVREGAETSSVLSVLDATNRWLHLER